MVTWGGADGAHGARDKRTRDKRRSSWGMGQWTRGKGQRAKGQRARGNGSIQHELPGYPFYYASPKKIQCQPEIHKIQNSDKFKPLNHKI